MSLTPTMLLTLPMLVAVSRTAMVQSVMRMMVSMLLTMTVPMMATGAGIHATRLGDPLRGRALRCNLRFAPISAAIPVASVRFAHCALRLPGGSLRSPPCAAPTRSWLCSTAPAASPPCPSRHGAARRARRGTRFARPGRLRRLRRLRVSPRLVAVALRAAPVPASPCTKLRTAPCGRAPHDPVHYPRHLRPLKRRGGCALPGSPVSISPTLMQQAWPFRTARGGLGFHTRRIDDAGAPWPIMAAINCATS